MTLRSASLRSVAEVALGRQRAPQYAEGEHMVRYLRAANVKDGVLDLSDVQSMNFSPMEQAIFSLLPGDVLVTEGSGSLASVGASAVWNGELAQTVCFQNTLLRLRPRPGVDGRFLYWWARSAHASGLFAAIATGANIYHLSAERVRSLSMRVPSLEEQRRIADFLDAETSRIDSLRGAYERMKRLVGERYQAVVDAEVDAGFQEIPFKYAVRFREGPGIMAEDFRDHGVPLIRISGLSDGQVTLRGCNFLDPEMVSAKWSKFRLRMDDRLLSASATFGAVSVVDDRTVEGAIPYTGLIILRPAEPNIDMDYIGAFLESARFTRQIDILKTGATMQHFGPIHLAQIRMPLPPLEHQERIASTVRSAAKTRFRMIEVLNRQMEILAERRQAVITAAVTGQFDVTTASGRDLKQGV